MAVVNMQASGGFPTPVTGRISGFDRIRSSFTLRSENVYPPINEEHGKQWQTMVTSRNYMGKDKEYLFWNMLH